MTVRSLEIVKKNGWFIKKLTIVFLWYYQNVRKVGDLSTYLYLVCVHIENRRHNWSKGAPKIIFLDLDKTCIIKLCLKMIQYILIRTDLKIQNILKPNLLICKYLVNNSSVNFSSAMVIFIFWDNLARNKEKSSHGKLHMDQLVSQVNSALECTSYICKWISIFKGGPQKCR